MKQKFKQVTLRFTPENFDRVKKEAEKRQLPIANWLVAEVLRVLEKRVVGRPQLSSEQKVQNKLERDFREEETLAFASDSGVICPGSGELWLEDKSLSGFKFPSGLCGVCHRVQFGLPEIGGVRVRKHKDGTQTDEEIIKML